MPEERLTRDLEHAMIGGVIAGMARYWDLDVTLLRVIALVLILPTGGLIIPVYLAAWIIVPRPDQVAPRPPDAESRSFRERLDRTRITVATREATDTARRAADRMAEAARLAQEAARNAADAARAAADAARTAAEEITDIAHPPAQPSAEGQEPSPGVPQRPPPTPGTAEPPPSQSEEPPASSGFTGERPTEGADPVEGRPQDTLAAEEQPRTESDREQEFRP